MRIKIEKKPGYHTRLRIETSTGNVELSLDQQQLTLIADLIATAQKAQEFRIELEVR